MGKEIDEWVAMYMSSCYQALFGTNIGNTPEVDTSYFMAYPWWHHDECIHLSCMTNNMRWDRDNGGCIPSVINGGFASPYAAAGDTAATKCQKNDNDTENNKCKHEGFNLQKFCDNNVVTCWNKLEVKSVEYIMSHYCMPQVTGVKALAATQTINNTYKTKCKTKVAGLKQY